MKNILFTISILLILISVSCQYAYYYSPSECENKIKFNHDSNYCELLTADKNISIMLKAYISGFNDFNVIGNVINNHHDSIKIKPFNIIVESDKEVYSLKKATKNWNEINSENEYYLLPNDTIELFWNFNIDKYNSKNKPSSIWVDLSNVLSKDNLSHLFNDTIKLERDF